MWSRMSAQRVANGFSFQDTPNTLIDRSTSYRQLDIAGDFGITEYGERGDERCGIGRTYEHWISRTTVRNMKAIAG